MLGITAGNSRSLAPSPISRGYPSDGHMPSRDLMEVRASAAVTRREAMIEALGTPGRLDMRIFKRQQPASSKYYKHHKTTGFSRPSSFMTELRSVIFIFVYGAG